MTINIASMIIGCILWEILKPYIHCKLIPEIKELMDKVRHKEKVEEKARQSEGYKSTTMGFTN